MPKISRRAWLAASLIVFAVGTVVAFRQTSRPDPYDIPQFPSLAWWKTPVETNAHAALPLIGVNLNAVTAIPGGEDVWIAGDAGVILHSGDGGETWEREAVRGAATAAPPPAAPPQQQAPPAPTNLKKAASLAPGVRNAIWSAGDDSVAWSLAAERPPVEQKQVPAVDAKQVPPRSISPSPVRPLNPPPPNAENPAPEVVSPREPNLTSLAVTDRTHGWAVGEGGVVLAYDGSVWSRDDAASALSHGENLNAIRFSAGGNRGWAVGSLGQILAYENGRWLPGKSFLPPQSSRANSLGLHALWLNDDGTEGWAAGDNGSGLKLKGGVWDLNVVQIIEVRRGARIRAIGFDPGGDVGWAAGDGGLLSRYANGDWRPDATTSTATGNLSITGLVFGSTGSQGWAVGDRGIILKYSGGAWRNDEAASRRAAGTRRSAAWLDGAGRHGWIVGEQGTLLRWAGDEQGWIRRTPIRAERGPAVHFLNAEHGWAVTNMNSLRATTDGGATWQATTPPPVKSMSAVDFIDLNTGWVVGETGDIAATRDGGATWTPQASESRSLGYRAVDFLDVNAGWVAGPLGVKSTGSGGATWVTPGPEPVRTGVASVDFDNAFDAVFFVDPSAGWVVGSNGEIFATVNGGSIWSVQRGGGTGPLNSVFFADRKSGWAVGNQGVILATTDGGTTWTPRTSGTKEPLAAVQFIDPNTGWAAGGHGTILATGDGGATWIQQPTGTRLPFVSLRFDSAKRGIAVAANLAVFRTDDGGVNWTAPKPARSPAPWYYLSLLAAAAIAAPAFRRLAPPVAETKSIANVLVSDKPLEGREGAHLEIGEIAVGLSRFLRNEATQPPLTIAVTGPWGSGKSSLMNLLTADMRRAGFPTVWFNAWHHQKEEKLLGALLDTIRLQAVPPFWKPSGLSFRLRLVRGRWKRRMPIVVAILVAFSLSLGYYRAHPDQWDSTSQVAGEFFKKAITSPVESAWDVIQAPFTLAMTLFGLLVSLGNEKQADVHPGSVLGLVLTSGGALLLATAKGFRAFALKGTGIGDLVARLFGGGGPETVAGAHVRFAEEFRDVTKALWPRKLLVNIDDLDRCGPDKVAEVLEAVNFLVTSGDCYVVLGMEPQWVRGCVGLAYKDVAAEVTAADGSQMPPEERARNLRQDFARQYLEKLINVEVPIPTPSAESSQRVVAPPDEADLRRREDEERVFRLAAAFPKAVAWSLAFLFVAGAYFVGRTVLKPIRIAPPPVVVEQAAPAKEGAPGPEKPPAPQGQPKPETPASRSRDAQPAFVSGAAPRREVWPVWSALAGLALLVAGAWRLSIRGEMIVKDSPEFSKALLVWQPLVSLKGNTPRALKRFLNKVRYSAMSTRGGSGVVTPMERLMARFVRDTDRLFAAPSALTGPAQPEEILVASSALTYVYQDEEGKAPSIAEALGRLAKETRLTPKQKKALEEWCAAHRDALEKPIPPPSAATSGARFIDEKTALGGAAPTSSAPPGGRPRSSA